MSEERTIGKSPLLAAPYGDPRVEPLKEAARQIVSEVQYDPHFSGLERQIEVETKLFLARWDILTTIGGSRWDQLALPVPMILHCPNCRVQHIDKPEGDWINPPHRSHLCAACGWVWRPADITTIGVAEIATRGRRDSGPTPDPSRWRHLKRDSVYTEIGRGQLQIGEDHPRLKEGDRLVAYRSDSGLWLRPVDEFDDGRFERLP